MDGRDPRRNTTAGRRGKPVQAIGRKRRRPSVARPKPFVARSRSFIDNWRWAGVPFFLRTGKRLPKRASEIAIHLKTGAADSVQRQAAAGRSSRTS